MDGVEITGWTKSMLVRHARDKLATLQLLNPSQNRWKSHKPSPSLSLLPTSILHKVLPLLLLRNLSVTRHQRNPSRLPKFLQFPPTLGHRAAF
jgi:hypothetical protein